VGHVEAALRALADAGHDVRLLQLGSGARDVVAPQGVDVVRPGVLSAAELARLVAGADLFLAPFVDGVSTRRTSFMAAIQHGVAVVTTDGPATGPALRGSGLALVDGGVEEFARAVVRLAGDSVARESVARAGEELYEASFSWPVITHRFLSGLDGGHER
jgi:glycosyltransferase involved in cell wall biosynthesis